MKKYKEKEYTPGKCFWTHFLTGVYSIMNPKIAKIKHYPYCCSKVKKKEYFKINGVFTYGCENCREEINE